LNLHGAIPFVVRLSNHERIFSQLPFFKGGIFFLGLKERSRTAEWRGNHLANFSDWTRGLIVVGLQAFLWVIWYRHLDFAYHEDHEGREDCGYRGKFPQLAQISGYLTAEALRSQRESLTKKNLCVLCASAVNPAFPSFGCGSAAVGPLWCALLLVSLSLAGCGNFSAKPDPSRFFTLTAIAQPVSTPAKDSGNLGGVSLGIGPIGLPGYLDREEIVTRVSPNRIDFSEYDRWAEPLDVSFTRVLAQNLSILLRTDRLVFYPWEPNRRPNYQVTVQVVRFESNHRGEVQLSARWEIFDISNINRIPLRAGESGITRQPTAQSTDASVAALSEALGDLSREIANAVSAVDGQKK